MASPPGNCGRGSMPRRTSDRLGKILRRSSATISHPLTAQCRRCRRRRRAPRPKTRSRPGRRPGPSGCSSGCRQNFELTLSRVRCRRRSLGVRMSHQHASPPRPLNSRAHSRPYRYRTARSCRASSIARRCTRRQRTRAPTRHPRLACRCCPPVATSIGPSVGRSPSRFRTRRILCRLRIR